MAASQKEGSPSSTPQEGFQALVWNDLPTAWKGPVDPAVLLQCRLQHGVNVLPKVGLEVPDTPEFRAYQRWHIGHVESPGSPESTLPLVRSNLSDFEAARGPGSALFSVQWLQRTGKPPVFPIRLFVPQ